MFRKDAVLKAGNYQDWFWNEDYYLWVRVLQHGFRGYNIKEPLLWMRAGADMYKRRGGKKYAESMSHNAVHGSDAPETAAVEVAFFFPGCDLI